jgi:hypothetical protein
MDILPGATALRRARCGLGLKGARDFLQSYFCLGGGTRFQNIELEETSKSAKYSN